MNDSTQKDYNGKEILKNSGSWETVGLGEATLPWMWCLKCPEGQCEL